MGRKVIVLGCSRIPGNDACDAHLANRTFVCSSTRHRDGIGSLCDALDSCCFEQISPSMSLNSSSQSEVLSAPLLVDDCCMTMKIMRKPLPMVIWSQATGIKIPVLLQRGGIKLFPVGSRFSNVFILITKSVFKGKRHNRLSSYYALELML